MRKLLFFLLLILIITGCSTQTLEGALSNSGYGEHDIPEILYQNDEVGVVIFLTKDSGGDYVICRSTFEKNRFGRYVINTNDDFSMAVDIGRKTEFIHFDTLGEEANNSLNIIWGGVFNYPGAKQVDYEIRNEDGTLMKNKVDINKRHIFVDVLSEEVADSHSITFDVMDRDGNVMFSYN
ncbi:hypothetical protein [Ornithinibacillus halotolerans]|uniref:Lipoprotein n=1 Tax=Ornithinibacillus halotolerans TaxID=1274357 RepID=A0A916WBV2_9BACI|nr:hypothetical protein [Ornithinibacillus halotolerans]GGA85072.1 hypothetical protein GCM10008025_30140 [Ornithinibacillus halotolerans]